MLVRWSLHAKHRFAERAAKHGLNYGDLELEIKNQKVKIKEGNGRFKTVFEAGGIILTAAKIETRDFIHVLTLWEANEEEAMIWKKK
ncbi:hypothetical protein HZB89_02275 [archaeon]|nr:hypothetical protein [archaeon]